MKNVVLLLLMLLFLYSCSPSITTTIYKKEEPLEYTKNIYLLDVFDKMPDNSEEIGETKIGDSGFTTRCDFDYVIECAKEEARKSGGNILKIYEHKTPDFFSTCHRIKAKIFKKGSLICQGNDTIKAINKDTIVDKTNKLILIEEYSKFRTSINIGFSYRTAKAYDATPEVESYIDGLRKGVLFSGELHYFTSICLGWGGKINVSLYSNSENLSIAKAEDNISLIYVAPSMLYRIYNNKKDKAFILGCSLGYLRYYNDAKKNNDNIVLQGTTLGSSLDIGADFKLSDEMMLGFQISYLGGIINPLEADSNGHTIDLKDNNKENLSRIELTIGLRFNSK